jgi:hypothetical protein
MFFTPPGWREVPIHEHHIGALSGSFGGSDSLSPSPKQMLNPARPSCSRQTPVSSVGLDVASCQAGRDPPPGHGGLIRTIGAARSIGHSAVNGDVDPVGGQLKSHPMAVDSLDKIRVAGWPGAGALRSFWQSSPSASSGGGQFPEIAEFRPHGSEESTDDPANSGDGGGHRPKTIGDSGCVRRFAGVVSPIHGESVADSRCLRNPKYRYLGCSVNEIRD